ncbi:MAG: hypothetical protein PUP91_38615 [Rhizonema sp. PD37]|nr:hypothetical protein [Rhizonema sp. PD37]
MLEAEGKTINGGLNPVCGGFDRERSFIVYKRLFNSFCHLPSALCLSSVKWRLSSLNRRIFFSL